MSKNGAHDRYACWPDPCHGQDLPDNGNLGFVPRALGDPAPCVPLCRYQIHVLRLDREGERCVLAMLMSDSDPHS